MLSQALEGKTKTNIMYDANLDYGQLQKYLPIFVSKGLIKTSKQNGRVIYITTDKGKQFLDLYDGINGLL